jgi:hypothetical protein
MREAESSVTYEQQEATAGRYLSYPFALWVTFIIKDECKPRNAKMEQGSALSEKETQT